jgi:hypothetical protein
MSKRQADKKMMEFATYVMCQELTAKEAKSLFPVKIIRSTSFAEKDRLQLEVIEEQLEKTFIGHLGEYKNGLWSCC